MKLNKTICLSEDAFKRSLKIDNFSKWVDGKLTDPEPTEGRQLALRAQIKRLTFMIHRAGFDCEDAACDLCSIKHKGSVWRLQDD